jgi:hypothetical protein
VKKKKMIKIKLTNLYMLILISNILLCASPWQLLLLQSPYSFTPNRIISMPHHMSLHQAALVGGHLTVAPLGKLFSVL